MSSGCVVLELLQPLFPRQTKSSSFTPSIPMQANTHSKVTLPVPTRHSIRCLLLASQTVGLGAYQPANRPAPSMNLPSAKSWSFLSFDRVRSAFTKKMVVIFRISCRRCQIQARLLVTYPDRSLTRQLLGRF